MNIAAAVLEQLHQQPGRMAICEPNGRSISCQDLHRRIVTYGSHLLSAGLERDDRVLVQVPNGIELAASILGAMLVGATPVLCEPGLGASVYQDRVRATEPAWLLVTPLVELVKRGRGLPELFKRLHIDVPPLLPNESQLQRVFVLRRALDRVLRRGDSRASAQRLTRLPRRDAMIAFTGGTTSQPKGVRYSHQAVEAYFANLSRLLEGLGVSSIRSILADTPAQLFQALRYGATAYIAKGRPRKRARLMLRLIQQGKIDAYFGSPYIWKEMMKLESRRAGTLSPSLRLVILGSSPVTRTFLQDLKAWAHPSTTVVCLYGLTEAGPVCVATAQDKVEFDAPGDLIGEPIAGATVSLAKEEEDDDLGEIVVRGPSLYTGYLGQPERKTEEGLHTGDIGRWVEHRGRRMLVLMGRAKDMIIRNSVNIYPSTIEPSLRELVDAKGNRLLADCALVGIWNHARQDEDLVLCYEREEAAASTSAAAIKARVEQALGSEVTPDFYLPLDHLPVTGRQNKVDKNALREMATSRFQSEHPNR